MSALANSRVVNIPACANTVSAADYDANRAALFDPRDPGYYKVRCEHNWTQWSIVLQNCRLVQYCSRGSLKRPCCSTQALVPSAAGGFLLGFLCVVGALVLAAWVRLRAAPLSCCTRCACIAATLCAHDAGSQLP